MYFETGYKFNKNPETTPPIELDKDEYPLDTHTEKAEEPRSEDLVEYDRLASEADEQIAKLTSEENTNDSRSINDIEIEDTRRPYISFEELWEEVTGNIADLTPNFMANQDKVVDVYIRSMNRSIGLGKTAGKFYNLLAKHGLRKPNKEHIFEETDPVLLKRAEYTLKQIYTIRSKHSRTSQALTAESEHVMNSINRNLHERPVLREEEQREGYKFETLSQIVEQEGGANTIEEIAMNEVYDDWNYCTANLYVHNKRTGQSLELRELLPQGYVFMPAEMRETKAEIVWIKENDGEREHPQLKNRIIPLSLNKYKGTQESREHFYESSKVERVAYGNITKKGGLLALLHEIGHAWQSKYHSNFGQVNWEKFYSQVTMSLEMLENFSKTNEKKETGDKDETVHETITNFTLDWIQKSLAELGVEIDENYLFRDQKLGDGKYKLSLTTEKKHGKNWYETKHDFYIKSDRVKPLIKDYVTEERDAWAHALRVLRLLRKCGFDLEPELKSLKDIQDVVHYSLGTYQTNLERKLKPTNELKNFTIKSRFNADELSQ